MKTLRLRVMWITGLAAVAVAAAPAAVMLLGGAPAAAAVPATVEVLAAPAVVTAVEPVAANGADPVVRRATTPAATAAPTNKGQRSGGDDNDHAKCLVKTWKPQALKSYSKRPVAFQQSKLICNGVVGTSEIIIEQNDKLVVAGSVVNNQTSVTLHSLTLRPNDEQRDTFCAGIARQSGGGSFGVVAQDCAPLGHFGGNRYGGKGRGW